MSTAETIAEAFEAAISRGDLPEHWSDPARAPGWWCENCRGEPFCGIRGTAAGRIAVDVCGGCVFGATPLPPNREALDAVAALGAERLVLIERLAAVAEPGSSVVWRVMSRRALYLLSVEATRGTWAAVCGLLASGASDAVAFPFGAPTRLREAARALVDAGVFVVGGAGTRMTITLAVVRPDTVAERIEDFMRLGGEVSHAAARELLALP